MCTKGLLGATSSGFVHQNLPPILSDNQQSYHLMIRANTLTIDRAHHELWPALAQLLLQHVAQLEGKLGLVHIAPQDSEQAVHPVHRLQGRFRLRKSVNHREIA